MKKSERYNRLFLVLIFIFFESIMIYKTDKYYDDSKNLILEQNLKNIKTQFETINKTLIDLADASFKGFIDRDDVKEAFYNKDREKLYSLLKKNYTYLTQFGFKQVHFHLANNQSFLRMHRPKKFGDDLTNVRYTVDYINRYHKTIKGFEIGKVLPGIRNLYPVFYKNKYIGSVELSYGIQKLEDEIENVYNIHTHFLIKKNKFDKVVFPEEKAYYKESVENKNYVMFKRGIDKELFLDTYYEDKLLKVINKKILTEKPFNIELGLNHNSAEESEHKHFIVSFLPISSVNGKDTAYLVFYELNKNLKVIENNRFNKKVIFSIMLIGTFLLLYQLMRNRELTLNAKESIEKQKNKYKDLMNLATDGIHILDTEGNIYEANKTFSDMLGYTLEEAKNLNLKDFDVLVEEHNISKDLEHLIKSSKTIITKHKRKDGTVIDVQVNAKGLEINGKKYLYASSRDITEQRNAYKKLEKFIDLQDNIVVVTDSDKLSFANKKFFEFLGFADIEQFNEKFESICDLFVENDRFFHLGKTLHEENWIEYFRKLPHSQRIVGMLMYDYNLHAFTVTVNEFEDDHYILNFTDITQTMLDHIRLENKTIHDKLTNAFNREYFEQNSKAIISDFTKENFTLGVAFLDIDHFKLVNDTFGHDIGDDVLVHFVKTIQKFSREHDILIRWGGEEFILLLKISSRDSLEKALEHIRRVIELEKFDVIGNITCSIGATMYIENEEIIKTIKRADEAVYSAKNKGRNTVEFL